MPLKGRGRTIVLLPLPSIIFLLGLTIVPLIISLNMSFQDYPLNDPRSARFVGIQNYQNLPGLPFSLAVTVGFTIMAVSIELAFGLGIALLLAEQFRGNRIARSTLAIPMAIPPLAAGLLWRFMLATDVGVMNYVLSATGLITSKINWLGQPVTALLSLVLIDVWQWTPFIALIILAAIQSLPVGVFEAANIDGASSFRKFWHLTLPMIKPAFLVALIFRSFDALKLFDIAVVTTHGGPGVATETLSLLIYRLGFRELSLGGGSALSYVVLIITLLLLYPAIRWLQKAK